MTEIPQTTPTKLDMERRSLHIAGVTLLFLALATIAFFGAYTAADIASPHQDQAQTASAAVVADPFASVSLIAKSAIVVDLKTGQVLYSLSPDTQLPLASLTKVAMTLAVTEVLSPDSIVTIPPHNTPDGAAMRLQSGETWRLQDLLDFTLVASSNEGAEMLAYAAEGAMSAKYSQAPAGSAVVWRMNGLAKELGLTNTYFLNVDGLDVSTTQSGAYGSARDMATLFAYAASTSPSLFADTTRNSIEVTAQSGQKVTAINTDEALPSIPGIIMGKTGYTDLAGGNLAIVFDAGPAHPVVAIVLGSTEDGRFTDMQQLVPAAEAAVVEGK
jgi:D-alanyl-D-alanine carboxypeptidase (penicillin-binding protein 5/6)